MSKRPEKRPRTESESVDETEIKLPLKDGTQIDWAIEKITENERHVLLKYASLNDSKLKSLLLKMGEEHHEREKTQVDEARKVLRSDNYEREVSEWKKSEILHNTWSRISDLLGIIVGELEANTCNTSKYHAWNAVCSIIWEATIQTKGEIGQHYRYGVGCHEFGGRLCEISAEFSVDELKDLLQEPPREHGATLLGKWDWVYKDAPQGVDDYGPSCISLETGVFHFQDVLASWWESWTSPPTNHYYSDENIDYTIKNFKGAGPSPTFGPKREKLKAEMAAKKEGSA
ncbi:hypothetical protein QBC38DRAFT_458391 [Podospora fimiseda]|uniref:Uncharacterized protein n=1 Tax=Podospora fimiseda TaxID=252190 RepID=A0AAN7BJF9_9PEZI|nr:hypothetical protein QBC38DRAFT_458391 [Podospora fimiseda]